MPAPKSLEEMLSGIEIACTGKPDRWLQINPRYALEIIAAVRSALSPIKYVCENCHTSKDNHNPECQQPDWRPLNPSAALSPAKGELPALDVTEEETKACKGEHRMARRTAAELLCRERQLLAAHEEIGRLCEELDICRQLESAKLPCGHNSRYGFTDDGGKTGYCTRCELDRRYASGQQKGRDECLEAVRDGHEHAKMFNGTNFAQGFVAGVDHAERAILALPKVGE